MHANARMRRVAIRIITDNERAPPKIEMLFTVSNDNQL
jgi:hypothetical protein